MSQTVPSNQPWRKGDNASPRSKFAYNPTLDSPFRDEIQMKLGARHLILEKKKSGMGFVEDKQGGRHRIRISCEHMAAAVEGNECRFGCEAADLKEDARIAMAER